MLPRHMELSLPAQVVNSLLLEIKDIAIFATKRFNLFLETEYNVCQVSFICKRVAITDIGIGKSAVGQGTEKPQGIQKKDLSGDPLLEFSFFLKGNTLVYRSCL